MVKAPDHGTLAGWRYTPAAGFAGQDTMSYRVTNGVSESELIRVSISSSRAVPPAPRPVTGTAVPVAQAPFLTARATPGWTAAGARSCGSPAISPAR